LCWVTKYSRTYLFARRLEGFILRMGSCSNRGSRRAGVAANDLRLAGASYGDEEMTCRGGRVSAGAILTAIRWRITARLGRKSVLFAHPFGPPERRKPFTRRCLANVHPPSTGIYPV